MSQMIGNKFWELRSKHGRERIFTTPDILWDAACEYFEYVQNNPLLEHDFVGKDAIEVDKRKMRAMTLAGLCLYLDVNTVYFNQFEYSLEGKDDDVSKEYSKVIARIRDVIWTQKFEGAAAGLLNANLISRELGIADKTETDLKGTLDTTNGLQPDQFQQLLEAAKGNA